MSEAEKNQSPESSAEGMESQILGEFRTPVATREFDFKGQKLQVLHFNFQHFFNLDHVCKALRINYTQAMASLEYDETIIIDEIPDVDSTSSGYFKDKTFISNAGFWCIIYKIIFDSRTGQHIQALKDRAEELKKWVKDNIYLIPGNCFEDWDAYGIPMKGANQK